MENVIEKLVGEVVVEENESSVLEVEVIARVVVTTVKEVNKLVGMVKVEIKLGVGAREMP